MRKMNTVILLFGILILTAGFCYAEIEGPTATEYGTILNLSGKQRMLTQKMSKEILLIALENNKDMNINNLKATSSLFDRTLKGLRDGDAELGLPPTISKRIKHQLKKTRELWVPFYEKIQGILAAKTVTKDQVALIAERNLPLLKNMNRCVKLYERDASKAGLKSDPSLAVTINLAGKQRMLTQKMSKEFLLVAYNHEPETNRLNLRETSSLFERTLKGLADGDTTLDLPGTKPEYIRKQLDIVKNLWTDFKPLLQSVVQEGSNSIPKESINTLANSNLPLLKEMNKAVKMYEKEASK